ncbi:MAG: ATP-binding protein, partial [Nitrosospira sp.]|nr:ATP-binding protein [Nitrosospira sp.]
MVNDVHEDNQISDQPIFRFIAIPLDGFEPVHTPHGRSEDLAHLFVGRTAIIDKLVDLLRSKSRRGSYLIAGYRGAGKTSVINKALKEYREGEQDSKALKGYREGEQEKARVVLDVRINLGDNS